MRGWSIPMGRLLGVEIRLHFFFALLLGLSLLYTGMSGMAAIRGVSLWLLLLGIVGLREIARSIVCAYYGLEMLVGKVKFSSCHWKSTYTAFVAVNAWSRSASRSSSSSHPALKRINPSETAS